MSTPQQPTGSELTREVILGALQALSEVLDIVGQYYAANRIPVKTQYLVEGLFEEGRV